MSKQEKENKKNALFGTIIFHAILVFLLTLPFMSLTYQDPPLPSGKGISINFSSDNSGFTSQSNNQTLKEVEDEVVEDEVVEVDKKVELDSSFNEFIKIADEKQKDSPKDDEGKGDEGKGDSEGSFINIDRTPKNVPIPKGNKNETGSVVIKITVDSQGKVILAEVQPSYTSKKIIISSNDNTLRKNALEAAYNTIFEPKESNEDDIGYIIFNFNVKGK